MRSSVAIRKIDRDRLNAAIFDRTVKVPGKLVLRSESAESFITQAGYSAHFNLLAKEILTAFPSASVLALMERSDDEQVTVEIRFEKAGHDRTDEVADFLDANPNLDGDYYRLVVA